MSGQQSLAAASNGFGLRSLSVVETVTVLARLFGPTASADRLATFDLGDPPRPGYRPARWFQRLVQRWIRSRSLGWSQIPGRPSFGRRSASIMAPAQA